MAGTITFQCYSCNQVLKVGSDKAGKKAKCIKCGTILTIPVESDEEEVEEVRSGPPRKSSARDDDDEPRRKRSRDDDDEDDDDRPRSRRGRDDDEDDDDRPRKRRSRDDDDEDDDDRPRSRRSRDDDDEDDDDRPRKRRSRDDDDDDYDRPRRRKGGGGGNPWAKVRTALMLNGVSAGLLAGYAGCMLLGLILAFISGLAQSIGLLRFSGVLLLIGFILYFALQILAVVAYVFFLFTPNKKGSFGLAITALVLGIINLVLKLLMVLAVLDAGGGGGIGGPAAMGGGFMPQVFRTGSPAVAVMLMIFVLLLLDSEWVIVPLYLRAVSRIVKDRYSEGGSMQAMGFGCGAIGAQLLTILLALAATSRAMIYILFFLQLVAFGVLLAFAIIYMRVNLGLRNNVD